MHEAFHRTAVLVGHRRASPEQVVQERVILLQPIRPRGTVRALREVRWPARLQVVGHEPWQVVDGAHNADSMAKLFAALRRGTPGVPFLEGVIEETSACAVVRTALWALPLAALLLLQADAYGAASLGCAFLMVLSLLALAYRDSRLDDVLGAAGTVGPVRPPADRR